MRTLIQTREQFASMVDALCARTEVVAPVRTDMARFTPIKKASDIAFGEHPLMPVKQFFFPHRQTLFLHVGKKMEEKLPPQIPRVYFGLRKCDLNAIRRQDKVYLQDIHDPYYAQNRAQSTLIGYHCAEPPSKYCFCANVELIDCFDLMYYDRDDHFIVEIGTERGEALVTEQEQHFSPYHRVLTQDERAIHHTDKLKQTNLKPLYNHPLWGLATQMCLSCGACTALCPTCYCHEIHDETNISDTSTGERYRTWSSCMVQDFTKVAGDHVFRKDHEQRFKHRLYHQLDYFKDKYGEPLCVGCGRCIDGCPTRIDFLFFINHMNNPNNGSH